MKVNKTLLFFCEAHFLPFPPQSNSRVFLWTIINMKPKKLTYGVGINDADYAVVEWEEIGYVNGKVKRKLTWFCPFYRTWQNMLRRCYSAKYQENKPTYKGCSVSDEWHTFSNFKSWMEKQDWEGKHLDKDLLFEGNKVYNEDTCVFVTQTVNKFTIDRGNDRGKWLIGASWNKEKVKFEARCSNPFSGKYEHLGHFACEQQAHEAWAKRKLELAHLLAEEQEDPRVAKALIDRYSKQRTNEVLK